MYGVKLEGTELEQLLDIEDKMIRLVDPIGNGLELDVMPWIRHIYSTNYDKLVTPRKMTMTWFDEMIQSREVLQ